MAREFQWTVLSGEHPRANRRQPVRPQFRQQDSRFTAAPALCWQATHLLLFLPEFPKASARRALRNNENSRLEDENGSSAIARKTG
jgi:hypothetical protein